MGFGLVEFARGMAASITVKAQKNGCTISEQLRREEDELTILLSFVSRKHQRHELEVTADPMARAMLGAAQFGFFLIDGLADKLADEHDLDAAIMKRAEEFAQFFSAFEEHCDVLEGKKSNLKRLEFGWSEAQRGA
jgi:hypothetical protein